ncbi:MAG: restriction endonuclease subunit M, partial [Clostridiales bacterium]|nr:restriction endonuclease subunit M [Clostridiales bacterium]
MEELHQQIEQILNSKHIDKSNIESLGKDESLYPFSNEGRILAYMLAIKAISYEQYDTLRKEYNNRNKYLRLFDLAPRTFGETWGEQHLLSLYPQFKKATKELLVNQYPSFDGEFDLWLDGIRVEVKACRANSDKIKKSLASRAYLHSEAKSAGFKYHYQQLKPSCCDVFIWIGVCRDELIYWV